jgi:hypothetical protein
MEKRIDANEQSRYEPKQADVTSQLDGKKGEQLDRNEN